MPERMSVEELLRATLAERAGHAPHGAPLAERIVAATRGADPGPAAGWRRRLAPLLAAAAVLAAVGAAVGVGVLVHHDSERPPTTGGPTTVSTVPVPTSPAPTTPAPPSSSAPTTPPSGPTGARPGEQALRQAVLAQPHATLGVCRGFALDSFRQADVTGDRDPEVLAAVSCAGATVTSPVELDVYRVQGGSLQQIGRLTSGTDPVQLASFTVDGAQVVLHLVGWGPHDSGCCPSHHYTQVDRWDGTRFVLGVRSYVVGPCGDGALTASGTTPPSGHAGSFDFFLLFTNSDTEPCTVQGFPGVDVLDASGTLITHAARDGPPGPTLTVAPGAAVRADLWYQNVTSPMGSFLAVTPPNTTQTTRIRYAIPAADVRIRTVVAG